MRLQIS